MQFSCLQFTVTAADVSDVMMMMMIDRVESSDDSDPAAVRLTFDMVKAEFAAMEANANAVDSSKE